MLSLLLGNTQEVAQMLLLSSLCKGYWRQGSLKPRLGCEVCFKSRELSHGGIKRNLTWGFKSHLGRGTPSNLSRAVKSRLCLPCRAIRDAWSAADLGGKLALLQDCIRLPGRNGGHNDIQPVWVCNNTFRCRNARCTDTRSISPSSKIL